MTDYEKFIQSLPRALPSEEQERLLLEYYETKNESIRNKLIEHNLRLCAKQAADFYDSISFSSMEELFSDCCQCLITAIDQYNPYDSSNSSFSFFAISLMKKKMLRVLSDNSLRKIYLTEPVALNKDEEEVDIFGFINSEDSERFVKDLEDKEFIQDVENYINTSIPENWREILKMHLGIGYDKQYSFSEIRRLTGFSRQYINVKMKKLLTKVKGFVIRKDPLLKSRSVIPDKEKMHEEAFNEYYGLDGSKVQRDTETIKQRYGFKRLEASIKGIEEKFIKSGKYTPKQIEDFKNSRKERLQKEKLDFYAYCYYSYYGLNEHTRKSISELAFEFNRSISGISLAIKSYKDYLNMKAENKQEAIEDDQPTA